MKMTFENITEDIYQNTVMISIKGNIQIYKKNMRYTQITFKNVTVDIY